jgi:ParB family chromosome partitioning protein
MGSKQIAQMVGASRAPDMINFDPEELILITTKGHPLYDPNVHKPVDESLMDSILALGILEPIIVRKNGEREDGKGPRVEVVVGRDRVKAARAANKKLEAEGSQLRIRVPAIMKNAEDTAMTRMMVAENLQRRVHGPISLANYYQRLIDMGYSIEETAKECRVSHQTVRNKLELLNLAADLQERVERGEFPETLVMPLTKLAREEQGKVLKGLLANGHTGGQEAYQAAKDAAKGKEVAPKEKRTPSRRSKEFLKPFRDALAQSKAEDAVLAMRLVEFLLGEGELTGALKKIATNVESELKDSLK